MPIQAPAGGAPRAVGTCGVGDRQPARRAATPNCSTIARCGSPKGRDVAISIVRRHRLAERLLVDGIGLEWEKVHWEADRWEHAISADGKPSSSSCSATRDLPAREPDPRLHPQGRSVNVHAARSPPGPVVIRRISEKIEITRARCVPRRGEAHSGSAYRRGQRLRRRAGRERLRRANWSRRTSPSSCGSCCLIRAAASRDTRLAAARSQQLAAPRPVAARPSPVERRRNWRQQGVFCFVDAGRLGPAAGHGGDDAHGPAFGDGCRRRRGSGCPRRRRTRSRTDGAGATVEEPGAEPGVGRLSSASTLRRCHHRQTSTPPEAHGAA